MQTVAHPINRSCRQVQHIRHDPPNFKFCSIFTSSLLFRFPELTPDFLLFPLHEQTAIKTFSVPEPTSVLEIQWFSVVVH